MKNRLKLINDFAVTLLMQSDIDSVLWTIADRIGVMLGFEDCVIYLREDDTLVQYAAYGEKQDGPRGIKERIEIAIGEGIVGHVAKTGIAEIVNDTRRDPRYIWDQVSGLSELAVPIIYENRVIGIIDSEASEIAAFSSDNLEFMQSLANMAAPRIASELAKRQITVAEARVRHSEETLQCIVEAVPDGIVTFDDRGIVQSFNAGAERTFGYRAHDVIGKSCDLLLPAQAFHRFQRLMHRVLRAPVNDGAISRVEMPGCHSSGRSFPMEISIRRTCASSHASLLVGTVRDITQQRQAQADIQYRLSFENLISKLSSDFINLAAHEVDSGIEQALHDIGKFTDVDAAYVSRFSHDRSKYSITHLWKSAHSKMCKESLQKIDLNEFNWWMGQIASGKTVAIEKLADLPAEARPERAILTAAHVRSMIEVPLQQEGRVTGHIGFSCTRRERGWSTDDRALLQLVGQIISNALHRKRADEKLIESRSAAQSASRAKSRFLANMSHELRTPLNAIIGYSELLLMDAEAAGQKGLKSDLTDIYTAGQHLLALVSDVLDLAKIEAEQTSVECAWFELAPFVADLRTTVAPLMLRNRNSFEISNTVTAKHLFGDATRIRQVLLNLLSNASKFTCAGEVQLDISAISRSDTTCLRFAVTDSGIGIAANKLDAIFSEFVQADSSTTREFGGTGLGLPISRKLCQLMGGDITVSSIPGKGSTFVAVLPVESGPAAGAASGRRVSLLAGQ